MAPPTRSTWTAPRPSRRSSTSFAGLGRRGPDEPAGWPDPAERLRDGATGGTPTELADGRLWRLADHPPQLGGVWDRLYDDAHLVHSYDPDEIRTAALHLLAPITS